jgi:uncharacterized membrane protein YqjE
VDPRLLLAQVLPHARLARVEWQQEKQRLLKMAAIVLLGFAALLCALLFAGALVTTMAGETWHLHALAGVALLSGGAAALAWRRFRAIAALGAGAFAASRAELSRHLAVLDGTDHGFPRSVAMRWLIREPELVARLVERVAGARAARALPAALIAVRLLSVLSIANSRTALTAEPS